jgi:hypothetical protein
MTIQRQYRYRNPLEVMEMEERRTCKGCIHKKKAFGRDFCECPKRHNGSAAKRCKYYETKEGK